MAGLVVVNPEAEYEYRIDAGTFRIGGLTKDVLMKVQDLLRERRALEANWLAVKCGIKGHAGLEFEDGTPVPFNTEKDSKGRTVVAESTLMVYARSTLMGEMAAELYLKGSGPKAREEREKLVATLLNGTGA